MENQKILEVFAGVMAWLATSGATGAYGTEVHTTDDKDENKNKIENTINPQNQNDALSWQEAEELLNDDPTISGGGNSDSKLAIKFDKKVIGTYSDIENLFEISSQIIFAELVLEENVRLKVYADGGRFSGPNTIGGGSMYRPENIKKDWNNPEATWFALRVNPKLASRSIDYEDMWLLQKGWGLHRLKTQGRGIDKYKNDEGTNVRTSKQTVLERMYNALKGASLTPNEFAAVFCAVYNNEGRINDICEFVKANYKNPVACAKKIVEYSQVKERGKFECFVYLNADNFVKDMFSMRVCISKNASCIYADGITTSDLTKSNYVERSNKCKDKYLCEVYPHQKSLSPKEAMTPAVLKHFKYVLVGYENSSNQYDTKYKNAKKAFDKGEYAKALDGFKTLLNELNEGNSGALMNDIALTCQKMGKHNDCIDYAKKVLATVDHDEYAKACYNAGISYMAQGNYQKAFDNFTWAEKHYTKYGVSNKDPDVDYLSIYKAKQKEAQAALQKQNTIVKSNGGRH